MLKLDGTRSCRQLTLLFVSRSDGIFSGPCDSWCGVKLTGHVPLEAAADFSVGVALRTSDGDIGLGGCACWPWRWCSAWFSLRSPVRLSRCHVAAEGFDGTARRVRRRRRRCGHAPGAKADDQLGAAGEDLFEPEGFGFGEVVGATGRPARSPCARWAGPVV